MLCAGVVPLLLLLVFGDDIHFAALVVVTATSATNSGSDISSRRSFGRSHGNPPSIAFITNTPSSVLSTTTTDEVSPLSSCCGCRRRCNCACCSGKGTILRYTNRNIDETTTSTSTSSTTTVVSPSSSASATTTLSGVIVDITIQQHRPLGCIIEESLATSSTTKTAAPTANSIMDNNIVFIASITSQGFAELAGLQVGDVIVGVSNSYANTASSSASSSAIMDVTGSGIERVKSLIMCRDDNEPFSLKVLRGTTALSDHEVALTELCSNPDTTSTETEQCMIEYIQGGYATINTPGMGDSTGSNSKIADVDSSPSGECLIDNNNDEVYDSNSGEDLLNDLHSLWGSDLPTQQTSSTMSSGNTNGQAVVAVKPWSSRVSPSGTYVRDPTTGKMKNLDSPS